MKKISFVCLSLLVFTSCKNEPKINVPTAETKKLPALKECTETQAEYETEFECIFKNKEVSEVYQATIKDGEIEKSELLLPELPKENTTKEINKDGLISISYVVSPKKTDIEFQFEGGVTTLSLEQQDKDVKRIIIHSAD